jgi:hypothetical protein
MPVIPVNKEVDKKRFRKRWPRRGRGTGKK